MNEQGHRTAYEELRRARARLLPAEDVRAYAELSFGMAFHLISIGAQRRFKAHREQHEGLARWLRQHGDTSAAGALAELEQLRTGHWYGRQGNGAAVTEIDGFLAQLEQWALA